ncbi:MAG TPA: TetR/AcrR family transcriptional regulator [Gammaproteobacteria bacterium]|nr:TetR/AcrR family transcriptional regulator [Gammaproteobacteria bacterium]
MARPQQFDRQQVLARAMLLFWRRGYANTSIRDLTETTRLKPGSLYGAFKNKRTLFLQALDHYFSALNQEVSTLLNTDAPPLERIRGFFEHLLEQAKADQEAKGCLLVNTLLEIPPDDTEINRRIADMLLRIEARFCEALQEAQDRGELARDQSPNILASLLITGIFGLRIYDRVQTSAKRKKAVVDALLSVLPGGATEVPGSGSPPRHTGALPEITGKTRDPA